MASISWVLLAVSANVHEPNEIGYAFRLVFS